MRITFSVYGEPRPAGSKRAFAFRRKDGSLGANVTDDCAKTKPWQAEVKAAAMEAYSGSPFDCPLELRLTFLVPRPGYHFRKNGTLKPGYVNVKPTKKPDLLKLARAVEDAMSKVIYRDDALIVEESLAKIYAERPGVIVTLTPLDASVS